MAELCDLQIRVNGQHTFFLNEKIILNFSGRIRKIVNQEKRGTRIGNFKIDLDDFPGGSDGFELISRFCYGNGTTIKITASNASLLHCCALYLEMDKNNVSLSTCNLLNQTQDFFQEIHLWPWRNVLTCLKNCDSFFSHADSSGLVEKLISSLVSKITLNPDTQFAAASPSSSSSSPDIKCSPRKAWWFHHLTILPPNIIERIFKLSNHRENNTTLIFTRFLLYYLKTAAQCKDNSGIFIRPRSEYSSLADAAACGTIEMGKAGLFSCRGLLWVLRIVSGFGVSIEWREKLEGLIGEMLDEATVDDLLVSPAQDGGRRGVYDVNLVLRLIRLFVHSNESASNVRLQKMKKAGRLVDLYLREIAPDQNLKVSKFLGISLSLPDFARDSFDGVYRAMDIFLQSHPTLSIEERSRLCRCLNYQKLSLEACKDLAKNLRIPPVIAVQALASQHANLPLHAQAADFVPSPMTSKQQIALYGNGTDDEEERILPEENITTNHKEMKIGLERMQRRVKELEAACKEMKVHMSKMVMVPSAHNRTLPRLC